MSDQEKPGAEKSAEEKPADLDTIIIAEDSAPNRKILAHLLQKLGFEVVACENGKDAFEKLTSGEYPRVVAIISDIMMPSMDGLEFLKNVRAHEKYSQLPFVLVTAVSDKDYIVQAKSMNVNGYILKPVTFHRVTEKLHQLFPNRVFPKLAA